MLSVYLMASLLTAIPTQLDDSLWHDIEMLSSPAFSGRRIGHNEMAIEYIAHRYSQIGLAPINSNNYLKAFEFRGKAGANIVGEIRGKKKPEQYFVLTAHFDHLGGSLHDYFPGADDNASGVAVMLALADYFVIHAPDYSILFVATDGEESGLYGSYAFLQNSPIPVEKIKLNINLDMLGEPERGCRLAVFHRLLGKEQQQVIEQYVQPQTECALRVQGRMFRTQQGQQFDWLRASDHYPFYRQNIPVIFFGGSAHERYHTPRDNAANLSRTFVMNSAELVLQIIQRLDQLPD